MGYGAGFGAFDGVRLRGGLRSPAGGGQGVPASESPAARAPGWRRAAGIALTAVAVTARAVPSDPVVLASGVAIGLGLPCVLIAAFTAVQRELPGPLLGRATATANTLIFTPNVIGLAAGAALVEVADYQPLLILIGLALLTTSASLALFATGASVAQSPARADRTSVRSPSDANPA